MTETEHESAIEAAAGGPLPDLAPDSPEDAPPGPAAPAAFPTGDRAGNGAELLVEALVAEGVDLVFGYPGGANMPIYDALFGARDRVRHVLVRHEQGAGHAAEGYARATGRPGVCMGTPARGATNLLTALADALMDSTPSSRSPGRWRARSSGPTRSRRRTRSA